MKESEKGGRLILSRLRAALLGGIFFHSAGKKDTQTKTPALIFALRKKTIGILVSKRPLGVL